MTLDKKQKLAPMRGKIGENKDYKKKEPEKRLQAGLPVAGPTECPSLKKKVSLNLPHQFLKMLTFAQNT